MQCFFPHFSEFWKLCPCLSSLVLRKQSTKIHRYCSKETDVFGELCTGLQPSPFGRRKVSCSFLFPVKHMSVWNSSGRASVSTNTKDSQHLFTQLSWEKPQSRSQRACQSHSYSDRILCVLKLVWSCFVGQV